MLDRRWWIKWQRYTGCHQDRDGDGGGKQGIASSTSAHAIARAAADATAGSGASGGKGNRPDSAGGAGLVPVSGSEEGGGQELDGSGGKGVSSDNGAASVKSLESSSGEEVVVIGATDTAGAARTSVAGVDGVKLNGHRKKGGIQVL